MHTDKHSGDLLILDRAPVPDRRRVTPVAALERLPLDVVAGWCVAFAALSGTLHLGRSHPALALVLLPLTLATAALAISALPALRMRAPRLHAALVAEPETAALRALARGLTILCTSYIALQAPDFPVITASDGVWRPLMTGIWLVTLAACVASWRWPALLLVPGLYLPGIKSAAAALSGFPYAQLLDITPVYQMAIGLALALVLVRLRPWWRHDVRRVGDSPAALEHGIVFVLIALHVGNYAASGLAKASLDGGPLYWVLHNRVDNIFHAGLAVEHLPWVGLPGALPLATAAMEWLGRPMAFIVFFGQLAAVLLFAHRRLAIGLLVVYDLMHVGIFMSQGANFFSWALINLAAIAAIRLMPDRWFGLRPAFAALAVMVLCQMAYGKFYRIASLGWYDSNALNHVSFIAEGFDGTRRKVPNAFFGFYSYPMSHMSFGLPEGGTYVPTSTNGGTDFSAILSRAERCDFDGLDPTPRGQFDGEALTRFVQARHARLARIHPEGLPWSANLYWHHFWNPPGTHVRFADLRLADIRSYEMVVESICLRRDDGSRGRQLIDEVRFQIPLPAIDPAA